MKLLFLGGNSEWRNYETHLWQERKVFTDMEKWSEIRRRVLVEGESKRSIQRRYGLHWDTLEKILGHAEPPGYRLSRPRVKRKIGPYLAIIHQIIEDDKAEHRKQRHTAKRIFDRLRAEYGFDGGYTIVKDAVREYRLRQKEVFVPLRHDPGEAQTDYGRAQIDYKGERITVAIFVMTLPYSGAIFIQVYPRECKESFQEGHRAAFEFFGGVPHRISYDNLKIAVTKVIGRNRELNRDFLRLKSHYLFESHFCRVRKPNEKGHVENLLGYARRNFLVPVPRVDSFAELNRELKQRCLEEMNRCVRGKDANKAELFEHDRAAMLPLPKQAFEARRIAQTRANSLSLVRFDCNDYSVPTSYAYHDVTAVGGMDEVRLIADNAVVARHVRCWDKEKVFFYPVHYLALLERKPGAFDYALPLVDWELPSCFNVLRRRLESQHEGNGTREFIKVLRLLEKCTLKELTVAVEQALEIGATECDAVSLILEHRREKPCEMFSLDGRPHLRSVSVESIDLSSYNDLTSPARVSG
jgi:transposase